MEKKTPGGARKQGKRFACLVMLCCVVALISGEPPAAAAPLVVAKTPVDAPVEEQLIRVLEPVMEEPIELPEEEPEIMLVPEAETPVEDDYFADVLFLGDSRTHGLQLYGGLTEGTYFHAVGATVESVFSKATQELENGKKVPMVEALAGQECKKVYVMLGVNELGWPLAEKFREQFSLLVDRIREELPDAEVVIQSILPVSAKQDAKKTYVNNGRIVTYNTLLEELAQEKKCPYLNVAEAVVDETGCLRPELTSDGVHLNIAGSKEWVAYLKSHPVN
ncbi:MAG: hypothetical protein IJ396_03955 [Oscillibacter sp.]|nr:hypothetical protein [Oscillibacter sp.]